ncbi:MAG: hypothetical protein ACPGVU_07850 [Limisphaerales bacterium]
MSSNDWAEENLQVIRTLMERASVYRRKMAPMMFLAASVGTAGGFVAQQIGIQSMRSFSFYWSLIAAVILLVSGYIVRGQAIGSGEQFWTAPTKRIFLAFLPVFVVGGALGLTYIVGPDAPLQKGGHLLVVAWCFLYGLGLHSAGFFVAKGIRRLGWFFIIAGLAMGFLTLQPNQSFLRMNPSFIMGAVFGGLHLLSGIYLFYTEQGDAGA